MATVTGHRPNWITAEEKTAIESVAVALGAPLDRIFVTAETSKQDRAAGNIGRVILMLGDNSPGWRASDQNGNRGRLKSAVAELLPTLAIRVQAAYSCLSESPSGMIERRDDSGNVIGAYEQ